ncbi:MBL fold metallo-hydrolase, partial [Clostridioides difficile]|uniref:MBL fold metallo-hydrolase n=1 Tax=Clostridioides difficile TaxID=1496 RepID=UPI00098ABAF9
MSIQNYLNQIKSAVFGKDVRQSIHDAIKQCYDDASIDHDNANMEVKLARGSHDTLNERFTSVEENIKNNSEQLDKIDTKKVDGIPLYLYVPFKNSTQGDCFIINYNNKTMIIDTGLAAASDTIINYIKTKGIDKIDYMFITHYHTDHCQGLENLVNSDLDFSECLFLIPPSVDWNRFLGDTITLKNNELEVKRIIIENNSNYIYLTDNYEMNIDRVKLKFLNCNTLNYENYYNITGDSNGPIENSITNYNNFSVALMIEHEKNRLFFSSDIDIVAQGIISSELSNIDFMCYPHHCCNELSNDDFHKKLSPKICLATGVGYRRYSSSDLIKMFDIATSYSNSIDFEMTSIGNTLKVTQGKKIIPYSPLGKNSDSIPENSDLNNYVYAGEYYSSASTISKTLLNCPISNSGFRLKVTDIISGVSVLQEIIANNSNVVILSRYVNNVEKTQGEWVEITRTTLNNRMIISTSDTLVQCINRISDYNFKVFDISSGTALYEQL